MLDSLFDMELPLPVKLLVAFAIVLVLLAAVMWVFKRFGGNRLGAPQARGRQPRLAVIDAAAVDGRRRLVLIRRDNVEHLIMIGGPTDVVVEQNIVRAIPVALPREAAPREALSPRAPEPVSRQRAEPPPPRAPREEPAPRQQRTDPRAEMPPRRAAENDRYRAEPPRASYETPRPQRAAPALPRAEFEPVEMHPAPPTSDTSLADMAHKLEAALRRPGATRRDAPSANAPPALTEPVPPTAPEHDGNGGRHLSGAQPQADAGSATGAEGKPPSKSLFDSLEEEMASLLNRPPEKK